MSQARLTRRNSDIPLPGRTAGPSLPRPSDTRSLIRPMTSSRALGVNCWSSWRNRSSARSGKSCRICRANAVWTFHAARPVVRPGLPAPPPASAGTMYRGTSTVVATNGPSFGAITLVRRFSAATITIEPRSKLYSAPPVSISRRPLVGTRMVTQSGSSSATSCPPEITRANVIPVAPRRSASTKMPERRPSISLRREFEKSSDDEPSGSWTPRVWRRSRF